MPRTIEERLNEVLEILDNTSPPVPLVVVETYAIVDTLLADFRAEGIAGRTIRDSKVKKMKHDDQKEK